MRVMVTGAAGQLGSCIVERFKAFADVAMFGRRQLDIADEPSVLSAVRDHRPDILINCAAFNDVDGAEERPADALAVNALGVLSLARAAAETGATLIHYSTDFVFDGTAERPYTESDPPCPLGAYAASKLLGEWFAADATAWYVLRVESLFGGKAARSSVDRIVAAIRRGEPARVFVDRTVTPSYVEDVAAATAQLIDLRPPVGVYHCVNTESTTWLGIAEEAARLLQAPPAFVHTRVDEVRFKAPRPRFCALSNEKLASAGIAMPRWQEALARYLASSPPAERC
ncbi:MAG TPA: dTDP-4-dehydrorhamnose reductase [Vicinamibacterales bacterium]|nr:dTDP-4-dehydrorhamnose reductase [Vicinamibacterales bacterium]